MESRDKSGQRRATSFIIDRLVYGAIKPDAVVPFDVVASLALPLCEIEYGGESHYLMRTDPAPGGRQVYTTACGGELPERPAPTNEPVCAQCKKVVERMGYEVG